MRRIRLSKAARAPGLLFVPGIGFYVFLVFRGCGGGNAVVSDLSSTSSRSPAIVDGSSVFKEVRDPAAAPAGFKAGSGALNTKASAATIVADSDPQGAEIFINGVDTAKVTPATLEVAPGTITAKLSLSDFKDFEVTFRAVAGQTYRGKIKLQSTMATLIADSDPQGAEVYINAADTGKATPATLYVTPGLITVKLTKFGFTDFAASLKVASGKAYQGEVHLKPGLSGFDGAKAFDLLKAQVNFGPRVPGTASHDSTRDYLFAELKKVTDSQEQQTFTATLSGQSVKLTNLIGVLQPATTRKSGAASQAQGNQRQTPGKILLCAHWDTRPVADRDPDPANRTKPIPGANDGASGVALLLEAARVMKEIPPASQVIIVFFDAEDSEQLSEMFVGSKYFAAHMGDYRPDAAILLDMIGDANLDVNRDGNSLNSDSALYDAVLTAADDLGFGAHFTGRDMTVIDDHVSLINAGVPAIDLIDFEYPDASNRYWHTLADTPDKCSAQSLKIVGETVLRVVNGFKSH